MTTGGYREEVFSVLLALLLHQRGVVTAPEQAFQQAVEGGRRVPDVLASISQPASCGILKVGSNR